MEIPINDNKLEKMNMFSQGHIVLPLVLLLAGGVLPPPPPLLLLPLLGVEAGGEC